MCVVLVYLFSVCVVVAVDLSVDVAVDVVVDADRDHEAPAVMLSVPCLGRLCSVAKIPTILAQQESPKQ